MDYIKFVVVDTKENTRSEPMIISQIAKLFNMANQYVYQVSKNTRWSLIGITLRESNQSKQLR
jgi:hypothetical protein